MRLQVVKSKNAASLYVVKSIYTDGKRTSKVVEKLGTYDSLLQNLNGQDPIEWANEYIAELNRKEKEQTREILIKYSPTKTIPKNEQRFFNGGYLFLQNIYHGLGLDRICKQITGNHKFEYDLNSVLSRLAFSRIIYPSSKLATYQLSKRFIEQPNFELQHIYRSLEVIATESDMIQAELYKNSLKLSKRNTGVLYYDCTNYFFEIEQAEGLKQYTKSKDHKPNPAVQMGLFMDGDGIPLAFCITEGNRNEQLTIRPLEQKIISDFELSKFVVCTDAGLSSNQNRVFNSMGGRAFVTVQSIKKLKGFLKEWALDSKGWKLPGSKNLFDISNLDKAADEKGYMNPEEYHNQVFYKERWIKENGLKQRLIVTYSLKYREYLRTIRANHITRAKKAIEQGPAKLSKPRQNDYKRFVAKKNVTADGDEAKKTILSFDDDLIAKEEIYDGFYGVCTNLDDNVEEIIKINKRRWMIEESFRIMKNEFKARPVYLRRDDRIKAHFVVCFISLMIFRFLEKFLQERYTCSEIISGLKEMNFLKAEGEGYIPTYTRTDLTDDLHEAFGFRTDYQIVTNKQMKAVLKAAKLKVSIK